MWDLKTICHAHLTFLSISYIFTCFYVIDLYSSIILVSLLILGSHPTWLGRCLQGVQSGSRFDCRKDTENSPIERDWSKALPKELRFVFPHWWQPSWSLVGLLLPILVVAGITSRWVSNFWLWMVRKSESWQRQLSGAEVWEMMWDRTDRDFFCGNFLNSLNSET